MIGSPRQLRALASPLRQEIVDAVAASGACSIAQIAGVLGRAPDSLYFHVRRLVSVGLLVEREPRKSGRHVAAVYDVPARPMRIDQSVASARAMDAVISGVLRLAARDYRRGLKDAGARVSGAERTLWAGRHRGWLAAGEIARVNELIAELGEIFERSTPGPGKEPVAAVWVLTPVHAKKSGRRAKSGGVSGGAEFNDDNKE